MGIVAMKGWILLLLAWMVLLFGCENREAVVDVPPVESQDSVSTVSDVFPRPSQVVYPSPVWTADQMSNLKKLSISNPLDGAMFPPEIIAPTFKWSGEVSDSVRYSIQFTLETGTTNLAVSELFWRPDAMLWKKMKEVALAKPLEIELIQYKIADGTPIAKGTVQILTSSDEVGADIFYREVNLPFLQAAVDPSKIRWRAGNVSEEAMPKIVLQGLPVCGNCHSFSRDSKLLAMDIDYANTKASYVVTPTAGEMQFSANEIISWNQYEPEDGIFSFGLMSQISPDGGYAITCAKDSSVFVDMPGLDYSQLFFPIKGILVYYDRNRQLFSSLPGADDPAFVQANPSWSPDGKELMFAKTKAYDLLHTHRAGRVLLTRDECREFTQDGKPFQYDIYRIPFNDGKGGEARPVDGASGNGKCNFFPKYSPDGKWIVFCQAQNYMLLQPDSKMYIMPSRGGTPRLLRANLEHMNSWHSWSPNSRWIVFSSKQNGPYTQLWLTHIDEEGESTPPVLLENFTQSDRAANIPEFYQPASERIRHISSSFLDESSYVRAGTVFYYNSEWEKAVEQFQKALEINPNSVDALHRLGYIEFFVLDKTKMGMEKTLKAVTLDPSYAFSQYDLGVEYVLNGAFHEALPHVEKAIQLIPNGFDAVYDAIKMRLMLADVYLYLQNLPQALATTEECLRRDADHALANYKHAFLLILADREAEALEYLQSALDKDDSVDILPELHQYLAMWYHKNGDTSTALAQVRRASELASQQNNQSLLQELRDFETRIEN